MAIQRPLVGSRADDLTVLFAAITARVRARVDRRRLLAVFIALGVGLFVANLVDRSNGMVQAWGVTQNVVVARDEIDSGTRLTADRVEVQIWPIGLIPEGAVTNPELALGAIVTSAIGAGEPVNQSRIAANRLGLRPTERSITLPIPLAPPPLEVGDIVELIGVGALSDTNTKTSTVGFTNGVTTIALGSGRVVHVADDGITVAVDVVHVGALVAQVAIGGVEIIGTPLR
jgi:hypothetical protein